MSTSIPTKLNFSQTKLFDTVLSFLVFSELFHLRKGSLKSFCFYFQEHHLPYCIVSWQLLNYIRQNIITPNDIHLQIFVDDPDERILFKNTHEK